MCLVGTFLLWCLFAQAVTVTLYAVIMFYSLVGGVILIAMSVLAGVALRSTKSQVKRARRGQC